MTYEFRPARPGSEILGLTSPGSVTRAGDVVVLSAPPSPRLIALGLVRVDEPTPAPVPAAPEIPAPAPDPEPAEDAEPVVEAPPEPEPAEPAEADPFEAIEALHWRRLVLLAGALGGMVGNKATALDYLRAQPLDAVLSAARDEGYLDD